MYIGKIIRERGHIVKYFMLLGTILRFERFFKEPKREKLGVVELERYWAPPKKGGPGPLARKSG
jgi:hypothetical protein